MASWSSSWALGVDGGGGPLQTDYARLPDRCCHRRMCLQGSGVRNIDDDAVFEAVIYASVNGCACRVLQPRFGAWWSTMQSSVRHQVSGRTLRLAGPVDPPAPGRTGTGQPVLRGPGLTGSSL